MIEEWKRRKADRLHSLRAQLEPDEREIATNGCVLVTDQRIVFSDYLYRTRSIHDETRDAIGWDEISRWAFGQRHDERPLLRIEHTPHVRTQWVPATGSSGSAGAMPPGG